MTAGAKRLAMVARALTWESVCLSSGCKDRQADR